MPNPRTGRTSKPVGLGCDFPDGAVSVTMSPTPAAAPPTAKRPVDALAIAFIALMSLAFALGHFFVEPQRVLRLRSLANAAPPSPPAAINAAPPTDMVTIPAMSCVLLGCSSGVCGGGGGGGGT